MTALSLAPMVMGGVVVYVGLFHVLLYLRRRSDPANLSFGLTCLFVALYDFLCAGLYASGSLPEALPWQRGQLFVLQFAGVALLAFVGDYTGRKDRWPRRFFITVFMLSAAGIAFGPESQFLDGTRPAIKELHLPFLGTRVTLHEASQGTFMTLSSLVGLAYFAYLYFVLWKAWKLSRGRPLNPLLAALIIMTLGFFNDTAVGLELYQSIYLFEYAYLALVFFMAQGLTASLVEATRVQRALMVSERRLSSILVHADAEIFLKDEEGSYVLASPTLLRNCHLEADQILGKKDDELFSPEQARTFREHDVAVIERGAALTFEERSMVNGEERTFVVVKFPVFDGEGKIAATGGIATDISARKAMEEAIRAEREAFHTVLERAPYGLAVLERGADEAFHFQFINPVFTEITGFALAELSDLASWLHESLCDESEVRSNAELWLKRLMKGEHPDCLDATMIDEAGRRKALLFRSAPLPQERILIMGVDLTGQRKAEEERRSLETQMQEAQKLESLGVLSSGIAHDFNNLLVALLAHADLARAKLATDAPARSHVEKIKKTAARAAELTRQLLAYSGKGSFVTGALNVNDLVEDLGSLLQVSLSKRVSLSLHLDEDVPPVEGDPAQIQQVILNLITNASDAIGNRDGRVELRTSVRNVYSGEISRGYECEFLSPGRYVCIEVKDTGCGMDEETSRRIFEPFFTTKFSGRGLGLAAVLGIVRGHRGAIVLETAPGEGCRVRVFLPVGSLPQKEGRGVRRHRPEDEEWQGQGLVLVIDDEEPVREVTEAILQRHGFDVILARDGEEGLQRFQENGQNLSLVLLDLTMPKMNGHETLAHLRAISETVPIVLFSGFSKSEASEPVEAGQVQAFLPKPFDVTELMTAVRTVLPRSRRSTCDEE